MNIVFICDRNYIIPTKASINSIIKNKDAEDNICIFIIGVGLLQKDFDWITQFQSGRICIKILLPNPHFDQISITHLYVSKAALYKFLIPELIDVDKVLYLDSDILVLDSLRKLYETPLGDNYAAVVRDMGAEIEDQYHIKNKVPYYFNSGMMLLNLKALRKYRISQKLIEMRQNDTSETFMDQDTFNKVFKGRTILVPPRYNYLLTNFEECNYSPDDIALFYGLDIGEINKMIEHPVILHLTNKKKPWNDSDACHQYIWYQYAFKEDIPQIIQNVVCPWKKENAHLRSCMDFKMSQQKENILYYRNGGKFLWGDTELFGVTKEVWEVRETLLRRLNKWGKKQEIVIYGAGRMGQAVFKCLHSLDYAGSVTGFAVSNTAENVEELYEKRIFGLDDIVNRKVILIIAVKNISGEEGLEKIRNMNFENILDMNEILA